MDLISAEDNDCGQNCDDDSNDAGMGFQSSHWHTVAIAFTCVAQPIPKDARSCQDREQHAEPFYS